MHDCHVAASADEIIGVAGIKASQILDLYEETIFVELSDAQINALLAKGVLVMDMGPEPGIMLPRGLVRWAMIQELGRPISSVKIGQKVVFSLRLRAPPSASRRAWIDASGCAVVAVLAPNTLLLYGDPARLKAPPGVSLERWSPLLMTTPRLLTLDDEAEVVIDIQVALSAHRNVVAAWVKRMGTLGRSRGLWVTGRVRGADVRQLVELNGVVAIVERRAPVLLANRARTIMEVPATNSFGSHGPAGGAGETIAIIDHGLYNGTGTTTIHGDLPSTLVVNTSWSTMATPGDDSTTGHGTHVTSLICGSGAAATAAGTTPIGGAPKGTAPNAKVIFQAVGGTGTSIFTTGTDTLPGIDAAGFDTLLAEGRAAGARVHSNSWGTEPSGVPTWDTYAAMADKFAVTWRDAVIVVGAGNSAGYGAMGWDNDIYSPATAKNVISVGAAESLRPTGAEAAPELTGTWEDNFGGRGFASYTANTVVSDATNEFALFSSRGPMGYRVKPEVCAPGVNILGARCNSVVGDTGGLTGGLADQYIWKSGSSMSTALVAGVAADIRSNLRVKLGHDASNRYPSGALIKALLVNGARTIEPLPGTTTTTATGFGCVSLRDSLFDETERVDFVDRVDQVLKSGSHRTYPVFAIAPGRPLVVTLTWADGSPTCLNQNLQNVLGLFLYQRAGGGTGPIINLQAGWWQGHTQRLTRPTPGTGLWFITVVGHSVNVRPRWLQSLPVNCCDFALAAANTRPFPTPLNVWGSQLYTANW